jgi:hypothetical protein
MALMIMVGTTVLFINTSLYAYSEFEEEKLDLLVNYAADAAVDEMVYMSADLGMDYADFERVSIDPQVALDMFTTILMTGYDIPDTEENRGMVQTEYLPVFIVAGYDGFYTAQPLAKVMGDSGVEYGSVFTIKQPYLYTADSGMLYGLNLGLEECRTLNGAVVGYSTPPISKDEQLRIINSVISDTMMRTVYEQQTGNVRHTIYLPSEMTEVASTNAVKNVSVLAYVANIPLRVGKTIETFGIGGAKVDHQRYVVCYIKNGEKMYCYADSTTLDRSNIIEVLETPEKAAAKGYYFDYDYFKGD